MSYLSAFSTACTAYSSSMATVTEPNLFAGPPTLSDAMKQVAVGICAPRHWLNSIMPAPRWDSLMVVPRILMPPALRANTTDEAVARILVRLGLRVFSSDEMAAAASGLPIITPEYGITEEPFDRWRGGFTQGLGGGGVAITTFERTRALGRILEKLEPWIQDKKTEGKS